MPSVPIAGLDTTRNPWTAARVSRRVLLTGFTVLLAAAAASLRFGQRENESLPHSDSDYYLDMARVFAGEQVGFSSEFALQRASPQHYTRPVLPLLVGILVRTVPTIEYRVAFSVLNIAAAAVTAALLVTLLHRWATHLQRAFFAVPLFLFSFPQMNWGYHILTDTAGYAVTLAAVVLAADLLDSPSYVARTMSFAGGVVALGVLQIVGFMTRETAWFVPVFVIALWCLRRVRVPTEARRYAVIVAVALAAKLPHALYVGTATPTAMGMPLSVQTHLSPMVWADLAAKSLVAFHIAWIVVGLQVWKGRLFDIPDVLMAWGIAASAYVVTGYLAGPGWAHVRMMFAYFPIVVYLVIDHFERRPRAALQVRSLSFFTAAYVAVGIVGVALDPSRGALTARHLFDALL